MTAERWSQIEAMFVSAIEKGPEEREAFLDEACDGDPALRQEVASLLASYDQATGLLEAPAFMFAEGLMDSRPDEKVEGTLAGPYRLVRKIDEGGMGVVFLATRADDQFKQEVAVKLIKRGFDSEDLRRRFRHERPRHHLSPIFIPFSTASLSVRPYHRLDTERKYFFIILVT